MADRVLRMGVVGLSRGFELSRRTLAADPRIRLVAAADPRLEARTAFQAEFGGEVYPTAGMLFADPAVEVVYIATPHESHVELAIQAAEAGKHILVEKPMALDLASCRAMIDAAARAGVQLLVGPSHGFDPPAAWATNFIDSGALGRPRMATMLTYTDFLYRPRRPQELDTALGGGVVFSQAVHQVDVIRGLMDAPVTRVRATAGRWDPDRPTEGAYQAFLAFEDGASAVLTYSGYGRYDTDALMNWIGETGVARDADAYGLARQRLEASDSEALLKTARAYGSHAPEPPPVTGHEHFGFVLVSCEGGDLRLTPSGVEVYTPTERRIVTLDLPQSGATRRGVIDELWAAVVEGAPARRNGEWGRETLAICLAILRAAREGREVAISELEDRP
ncbi:Gfo/Idh/MocA family protein [Phenylobacterium sp.]|uniref:Gfo/Idh/MocA family protein n=1 Tax=Phenylobacterium sp. TaxID=1871053 RepID=UPI0037CC669B